MKSSLRSDDIQGQASGYMKSASKPDVVGYHRDSDFIRQCGFILPKADFIAPQSKEIIKNAQHKLSIFLYRPKVEIISLRTEVHGELL